MSDYKSTANQNQHHQYYATPASGLIGPPSAHSDRMMQHTPARVNNSVQRANNNYHGGPRRYQHAHGKDLGKHNSIDSWAHIQNQIGYSSYKGAGANQGHMYEYYGHAPAQGANQQGYPEQYQMWNTSAASINYNLAHQQHPSQQQQAHRNSQNFHQVPPQHKLGLLDSALPDHKGATPYGRGFPRNSSALSRHHSNAIRDFLGPVDNSIEDFRVDESNEKDGPRGSSGVGVQKKLVKKKPNLAKSIDSDSDEHQIFSQRERKSKLLLDEEETVDVKTGIEKIEKIVKGRDPASSSSSCSSESSDQEIYDFKGLARLNRRKTSPLQKLLKDVDQCMIDFFECLQQVDDLKKGEQQTEGILKSEAIHDVAKRECSENQQMSGQGTYQSLQDHSVVSSRQKTPPQLNEDQQSAQDQPPKPIDESLKNTTATNSNPGQHQNKAKLQQRRRSSIDMICHEKLNLNKFKKVHARLKTALGALKSTSRSKQSNKSRKGGNGQRQIDNLDAKIKKQENAGGNGGHSTSSTPKTPKFSARKSTKLRASQPSGKAGEEELKLNITGLGAATEGGSNTQPSDILMSQQESKKHKKSTAASKKQRSQKTSQKIKEPQMSQTESEESEESSSSDESSSSSDESMDIDDQNLGGIRHSIDKGRVIATKQPMKYRRQPYNNRPRQPRKTNVRDQLADKSSSNAPEISTKNTARATVLKPIANGRSTLCKKDELLKSFKEMEQKRNNQKMTILKRSKGIRKPQSAKQPRINKAEIQPSTFYCETCNEDFTTGQALGGHMSRVHPGQSGSYARKIKRREERTFDRELLRLAKIEHSKMYGEESHLDRVKIRRFKRNLRARILKGDYVEGYMGNVV